MSIKITLPVKPVTKKNSQQIITNPKTGRPFIIPSAQFRTFEKECKPYMLQIKNEIWQIKYPVNVQCVFYVDRKLRYDLTNLLEAIDDVLVNYSIILDDNRDILASHDGSRVFYDKFNPRIEIEISEMENYSQWNNTKDEQTSLFKH